MNDNHSIDEVDRKAHAAKAASRIGATASTKSKDAALMAMADGLDHNRELILAANRCDIESAIAKQTPPNMIDRLRLTDKRISDMQDGLRQVASLPDPIGEVIGGFRRSNGLQISKVRVPIGVIAIIYESRPNVTVDAAAICVKSGNAVVLRGGSESIHSNIALANVLREALDKAGMPADMVNLIETTDRDAAKRLMTLNGVVDCLIPRGGASLIETVLKTATVPVIETGTGNCHIYVDKDADQQMALDILINAKVQRPSVCNSAETLLVHRDIAREFVPKAAKALQARDVEIRGDAFVLDLIPNAVPATEDDWYREYNALIIAMGVVEDTNAAIEHINKYGTRHSEAIVTQDYDSGQQFVDGVDAAAVFINASTRFTDGYEFGFGAEIGISNQKLHARGPMGLPELTTYKYIIRGSGQVRN